MHAVFWIMTLLMTVVALLFVVAPLAREKGRRTPALLLVAVPAFTVLAYLELGSPGASSATAHAAATEPGHRSVNRGGSARPGSVSTLAAGLAARLSEQPDDGAGWLLLAKSYVHLKQLDEARAAYARAVALGETDDALAREFADGASGNAIVSGSVGLSPAAEKLVRPDDTVFIFARPVGDAGAPVAVTRKSAAAWPLRFQLTDAQSIASGERLSDYEQVIVTARVSRRRDAGTAMKTLEAKTQPIDVASNAPVRLTIH